MHFRPDRAGFRPERVDFRPERAWGRWMDRQMNERTNKQKSPCVLQDFVPFGAAAQKPINDQMCHIDKILWQKMILNDDGLT